MPYFRKCQDWNLNQLLFQVEEGLVMIKIQKKKKKFFFSRVMRGWAIFTNPSEKLKWYPINPKKPQKWSNEAGTRNSSTAVTLLRLGCMPSLSMTWPRYPISLCKVCRKWHLKSLSLKLTSCSLAVYKVQPVKMKEDIWRHDSNIVQIDHHLLPSRLMEKAGQKPGKGDWRRMQPKWHTDKLLMPSGCATHHHGVAVLVEGHLPEPR